MAATRDVGTGANNTNRNNELIAPQVADARTVFAGALSALAGPDFVVDVSELGRIVPWDPTVAGLILLGTGRPGVTEIVGTLGAVADTPRRRGGVDLTGGVRRVVVATLAGTQADVGQLVYATDDDTYTLAPSTGALAGMVHTEHDTTDADVLFFSFETLVGIALAGGNFRVERFVVTGVSGGGGDVRTGLIMQYRGRIVNVDAMVIQPLVGGGADISYNLEIGGVNVTGGVVQVVLADSAGTRKSGSTVTAANRFGIGSVIDIEVAESTASTAGLIEIIVTVVPELGT